MDAPRLGILLDVDGPVSSPETRTVAAGLLADLQALLAVGIPVVLNTGRATDFVDEHVLRPLASAGLPPGARLHAVCEKGGSWTSAGPEGAGVVHTDPALRVPDVARDLMTTLVERAYGDAMFVDRTKRVMATVEARTDVPNEVYRDRQSAFDAELVTGLTDAGLGVRHGDRECQDAHGRAPWRIDSSVIATDLESADSGKALGARRALALLEADGPIPRVWHTVGDSRGDYAMAAHLHALGHDVTHVDVGPQPPLTDRPYEVLTVPGLRDESAGAAHLRGLVDRFTA